MCIISLPVFGYANLVTSLENISFSGLTVSGNNAEYVSYGTDVKSLKTNQFAVVKDNRYRLHLVMSGYNEVGFYNHSACPAYGVLVVDDVVVAHVTTLESIDIDIKSSGHARLYVYAGGLNFGSMSVIVECVDVDNAMAKYALLGLSGLLCAYMFWGAINQAFLG